MNPRVAPRTATGMVSATANNNATVTRGGRDLTATSQIVREHQVVQVGSHQTCHVGAGLSEEKRES